MFIALECGRATENRVLLKDRQRVILIGFRQNVVRERGWSSEP
jgi:hypothetical protein